MVYLVNKPLSAAGISEDKCPRQKDYSKNEQLAEKRSFVGSCEILKTIFQPRALSSERQHAEKGFIYFLTLRIISQGERTKIVPAYFVDVFFCCVFLGTELSTSLLFIRHWLLFQKVFFGFP